jgi:hypothetical protein
MIPLAQAAATSQRAAYERRRGDTQVSAVARKPALQTINEETHGRDSVGFLMTLLEQPMATPVPRKRKSAAVQNERTVKTSLVMGASLHLQLSVAASIAGVDRNALAVEILTEALRGIVVVDRRKGSGRSGVTDRPSVEGLITSDEEIAA